MFTGIIHKIGKVVDVKKNDQLMQYALVFPYQELTIGASISVDGVCQTVAKIQDKKIWFDAIEETIKCTTLNSLEIGQTVNIERAAKMGDEIGGHMLSGHIYGTTQLVKIEKNVYTFKLPKAWKKYLFVKGYVAINGISLTLAALYQEEFNVHLIPTTLAFTTLREKQPGDLLNIEFDFFTQTTVETVERILAKTDP
ncbi:MAG: riboflavin synthase subunit alpha [Chlamydiales bacterium]